MRRILFFSPKHHGFKNQVQKHTTAWVADTYSRTNRQQCSCSKKYFLRTTPVTICNRSLSKVRRTGSRFYCSAAQEYSWNFSQNLQQPGWLLRLCTHKVYLHVSKITIADAPDEFLNQLVTRTDGFSGDDIALLWREIGEQSDNHVKLCDVLDIIKQRETNKDKKHSISCNSEDVSSTPLHEAGHVVAGWFTKYSPLSEVSLNSADRKFAKPLDSKMQIDDMMIMGLGGFCAETMNGGSNVTIGAHQDLQKVLLMAYFQVLRFGMSKKLGPVAFTTPGVVGIQRPYSRKYLQLCEEEILRTFNNAYKRTSEILQSNKEAIQKVSDHLKQKSSLYTKDMERLILKKTDSNNHNKKDVYQHIPLKFHDDPRFTEKRIRVAFHEAGHAIIAWYLHYTDPVLQISIMDKPGYSGGSIYDDRRVLYKQQIDDALCMCLGGREAERLFFEEINSGSWNDLLSLTNEAYEQVENTLYVKLWKIPKNVKEMYSGHILPYSESMADYIDTEAMKNIQIAEQRARKVISERQDEISKIAVELLRKEVLNFNEIEEILGPTPSFQERLKIRLKGQVLWKYKALCAFGLAIVLDSLYLKYGSSSA